MRRAISAGRLHRRQKKTTDQPQQQAFVKSERSASDQQAARLGVACHDVCGRVFAAVGRGSAPPAAFSSAMDVRVAGVLCALPALVANGLFAHPKACLDIPKGHYSQECLLLLLSFLALARVPSSECIRYLPLGEWGLFWVWIVFPRSKRPDAK